VTREQLTFAILYQTPAIIFSSLIGFIPFQSMKSILLLPGVFLHEMLHLIVGFVTLGYPVSIDLIPKKGNNGSLIMGSVEFMNIRWYNGLFIGLAPLLGPVIMVLLAPSHLKWNADRNDFYYWTISSSIFSMCIPSISDLRVASKSWLALCIGGGMVCIWIFRTR
jgi:hypothetical protein